jgi:membrane peptidoglycan carboxypeptidase
VTTKWRTTKWRWPAAAAGLVLILGASAAAGYVLGPKPSAPAPFRPTAAPVRPSSLYASDGTTLIARFDSADPHRGCLGVKRNDWGFFCDYLVAWWAQQPGLTPLPSGGYRVVSSLDAKLQAVAAPKVKAVSMSRTFSLVSVQPGTGLVRTMAVNRTYGAGDDDVYGPTTTAPFATGGGQISGSPGQQTFEPFALAAAFEKGVPLNYTINTERRYVSNYIIPPGGPDACVRAWCPSNKDGFAGKRNMWQALTGDVTTYFVPLEEQIGSARVIDVAERLGIRFPDPSDAGLIMTEGKANWGSFALGVSGTTALDLATAYATIAADGKHCDPRPVQQITDPAGHPVAAGGASCRTAVTPDVARATIDVMRCPVGDRPASGGHCGKAKGPASGVRADIGRPVAGMYGIDSFGADPVLALTSPQLATAGLIGNGPHLRTPAENATKNRLITAVTDVEAGGLKPLPTKGFTAPSKKLVGVPGQTSW